MDISTHQTSLFSLLSLCSVDIAFFSDLNYFFACHMLFYFPIPLPFFLCHFCFVILPVCNFSFLLASCLFFISLFAHSHFLCRSTKLFSPYFFSLFIWQQTTFFSCIILLLSPFAFFFPYSLYLFSHPHDLFFIFCSFSSTAKLMKILWGYIYMGGFHVDDVVFTGIFHFGGSIQVNFRLIIILKPEV